MLIYQIYPRSFYDSNGDGIGDLNGIIQKLPYVARLGVDAVWLSPFVASPQKDFGYDVSDYCAVDPRFGTLDDFKTLLGAAHALGLKVLMDQVWCHCSDQHPWFKASRNDGMKGKKRDWFVWADAKADGTPPNNWLSYFGGSAWSWDSTRQQYYFHQFLPSQPTFNLRHPALRQALRKVARFWLELGVDGFRLDAIHTGFADPKLRNNPVRPKTMKLAPDVPATIPQARQWRRYSEGHKDTLVFLQEMRQLADRYGALLLGEVNGENSHARAALYTAGKTRLHTAYNFGLLTAMPQAEAFRAAVSIPQAAKPKGHFCYALSNHDVVRVASRWPDPRLALVFGLLLPGDYCLYQGEELGLMEAEVPFAQMVDPFGIAFYPAFKGRDGCRTPMPWRGDARHGGFSNAKKTWLPFAESHCPLAVDKQRRNPESTLTFAKRLIAWRKQQPALQGEGFRCHTGIGSKIVFERFGKQQRIVAVFNLGKKPLFHPLPHTLLKDMAWVAPFSLKATLTKEAIKLPPYACALFVGSGL